MRNKILVISLRSDLSGGPRHLANILPGISEEFEVYLATPLDAPFGKTFLALATKHFKLEHRKFKFSTFLKLLSFCKQNQIGLAHSHGRGAGIYSRILSLFGVKVIHTYHGVHSKNLPGQWLKCFVDRALSLFTHYNIFISRDEKTMAEFNGYQNSNSKIIPNGVSLQTLSTPRESHKITLGTLTRLDPHKGNLELLRLFSTIENDDLELKIAGKGTPEEIALIEKSIKSLGLQNRVQFLGPVKNPYQFLEKIDIYISASHGEGLPYSLLEAMSLGLPVAASNVPGHRELIPSHLLFEFNSSSFKKTLEILSKDAQIRKKEGLINYKNIEMNYSLSNQVDQIKMTYRQLF